MIIFNCHQFIVLCTSEFSIGAAGVRGTLFGPGAGEFDRVLDRLVRAAGSVSAEASGPGIVLKDMLYGCLPVCVCVCLCLSVSEPEPEPSGRAALCLCLSIWSGQVKSGLSVSVSQTLSLSVCHWFG